ncbi:MAG: glycosyltransferase [Gammaproteobacteria bacterium]|nr:glycosyltransferase [Gammaproteobacteria bacterium]
MKITIVSTTTFSTPPEKYGGEVYVHWLCEALAKLGHHVTLIASYGSKRPTYGKLIQLRRTVPGDWMHMLDTEEDVIRYHAHVLRDSDIVHDFSHNGRITQWCIVNGIPTCNTLWGITYIGNSIYGPFRRNNVVTWSNIHKEIGLWTPDKLANSPYGEWHPFSTNVNSTTKVVVGGVDTDAYFHDPSVEREDWFLFLARAHPSKGVEIVLDIARRNPHVQIKMAGSYSGLHKQAGDMYKEAADSLDNIEIIEDVGTKEKLELYQKCKAFLFPVQYVEAFGIVVTEAMATGAPLIVSDRGSMPELVEHSVNGFICGDVQHYENAMKTIEYINPDTVREHCVNNFSMQRVAEDYIEVYKCAINGEMW